MEFIYSDCLLCKGAKENAGGEMTAYFFWNFQLILIFRQQFGMNPVQDILRTLCLQKSQCSQPVKNGQCSDKPKCEIPADVTRCWLRLPLLLFLSGAIK